MPTLVTEQGIVHYEAYGRGRPVIFLHGWLGSWALWRDSIEAFGKEFRTYALDFFGFGDSFDRNEDFSVSNFVELVSEFMDRLGIPRAPLVGHSMGGTVSLGVASRYPEKVVKVIVIGSPIQGKSLNFFLKLSGYRGIAQMTYRVPLVLPSFVWMLTHVGTQRPQAVHRMVADDLTKVTVDAFFQSIGTLRKTDLTEQVKTLQMPILGMYGKRDYIVHPNQGKYLLKHAPNARQAWFPKAGHFIMADEPDSFYETVTEFLKNG